ncbi:hypothetical protein GQ43DRAFT_227980 [Delitschia confertaspora ATCC 74209]|uniref:Uncharacterized protein n=1 Tax=Delitschia confertaspora ATCC 74209 TaxID=1513339 RepID=A0A9P4MUE2_9PLEO|nr:hypothetical protein GQ43DRAFT_227980 [Delitschia confertaspora ATCC 74209]
MVVDALILTLGYTLRKSRQQHPTIKSPFPLIPIEPPLTTSLTPDAEVISIPYGPFTLKPHSMLGDGFVLQNIAKPCTECFVTAMHAYLRTPSSPSTKQKSYNLYTTTSGLWLHHIIFFNLGRPDPVCARMEGERFFGGGNERWTRRWNSISDHGYEINANDKWDAVIELMNDADEEVTAEIVVRYEIISKESKEGKGYKNVRAVWLDLTGCGNADVDVKSTTEAFEYRTPNYTSSVSGLIVDVAGHLHDGGLTMLGYKNGDLMCRSDVFYDNQAEDQHIEASGVCKDAGRVGKGDVMWAEALYDPNVHRLTMHEEGADPVMGSMGVYVGVD